MAWETRKGHGRYYTRSKRVEGRVVREYVGSGEWAEAMVAMDEAERARRVAERADWREERECHERIDRQLDELNAFCTILAKDALENAGFHQHHRGEWRRRRVPQEGGSP
jgi:hypothetical protein